MHHTNPPKGDAQSVVIDRASGQILVDGEPIPYYLGESGPVVEQYANEAIVQVPVFICANSVEVLGDGVMPVTVQHLRGWAEKP